MSDSIQRTTEDNLNPRDKTDFPGPFIATVVGHLDSTYMGGLEVNIMRTTGNLPNREGETVHAMYASPFFGSTSNKFLGTDNTYENTQKAYGMWFVPPDVGTMVLVIKVNGFWYWFACVPDPYINFMVPGIAATSLNTDDPTNKVPVAEYNKSAYDGVQTDLTQVPKAKHPFTDVLSTQGLLKDETRGITTSSARREVPSSVFGISTPGPVDRQPGAKKGKVGFYESPVSDAFVSRMGGTTFVLDDGDPNLLRKGHPKDTPPIYASVANEETDGDVTRPHNELVRIRTRTGHQILMHNSEDLIYIGNARGTTWIELTSNGKIDIYAADDISFHTDGSFNVTANKDINLTAGKRADDAEKTVETVGSVNINASNNIMMTALKDFNLKVVGDSKIAVDGQSNIYVKGNHVVSAAIIHHNGPAAAVAGVAPISPRVPMVEPWDGHENLHTDILKEQYKVDTPPPVLDPFKKIGK